MGQKVNFLSRIIKKSCYILCNLVKPTPVAGQEIARQGLKGPGKPEAFKISGCCGRSKRKIKKKNK